MQYLLGGAAICSQGVEICFLKVPLLAWQHGSCRIAPKPVELSENSFGTFGTFGTSDQPTQ